MKLRTDFVTNSSSSSFILAFANKMCIEDVLKNENTHGKYETILSDVIKHHVSKSFVIDEFREESYWDAMNYVAEKHNINIWDFDEEKYESEIKDRINELADKYIEKIEGFNYFAYVTYSDDDFDGYELEHEIVPRLSCTVSRFIHH